MGILDAPGLSPAYANSRYNFTPAQFRKWNKALIDTRLGASDTRLLVVSDSTAAGVGSSTAATVPQNRSWPSQLADLLNTYLVPAARGLATPKSNSSSQTADTRWTLGTGWYKPGATGYIGFGGGKNAYWENDSGSTGGSLVFADPTILADSFDVYFLQNGGSAGVGTATATATGGSAAAINEASGSGKQISKVTAVAATAATSNTLTIAPTGAAKPVHIVGIEPFLSTTKKVRVGNAGISGSAVADWTGTSGNAWTGLDSIKAYAPHLTVIDLGINDAGSSVDAATYLTGIQAIVAAAQVSGDVILKSMIPSSVGSGRTTLETAYVNALRTLGLPTVDLYNRSGGNAAYFAAGFMNADGIHGNDYSYVDTAQQMLAALRTI